MEGGKDSARTGAGISYRERGKKAAKYAKRIFGGMTEFLAALLFLTELNYEAFGKG
jgi:hypothetical protein